MKKLFIFSAAVLFYIAAGCSENPIEPPSAPGTTPPVSNFQIVYPVVKHNPNRWIRVIITYSIADTARFDNDTSWAKVVYPAFDSFPADSKSVYADQGIGVDTFYLGFSIAYVDCNLIPKVYYTKHYYYDSIPGSGSFYLKIDSMTIVN
ncbi:MAG: hypothetical protein RDU76_11615 [Candidatus Edwardsbacteria bacterium]|nr:hypothetical protein [Candidatus Edwardsbacteria bacterium]